MTPRGLLQHLASLAPGLAWSLALAGAAWFIADHYGGPSLLFALLLGLALHPLVKPRTANAPGIAFSARTVLRLGVALLGARITLGQFTDLGWPTLVLVGMAVPATIACGVLAARWLGLGSAQGVLTGGAVAICGASAALAIGAALRQRVDERAVVFAVVGVTTLSTVAMVLYPLLARGLGMDAVTAGAFLGGSIHDVAQVVGAGYMMSDQTGDVATVTKMLRVALLVPVVLVIAWQTGSESGEGTRLPSFLVGFLVLMAAASLDLIPPALADVLGDLSRACLVTAIAALGLKTSFGELATLGWRPLALMVGETIFMAAFVLLGLLLL